MNRPGANGNGAANGERGCCGGNGASFSLLRIEHHERQKWQIPGDMPGRHGNRSTRILICSFE